MDEPTLPRSANGLGGRLRKLRNARRRRHLRSAASLRRRERLTPSERAAILSKTARRCHICGGTIQTQWQADHVLAYSSGGRHHVDNYLPAHRLCNNYRWDYSSLEFQWILKIGVWARRLMEQETELGKQMLADFYRYDAHRHTRRRA